ncbi:MAG: branched-chain amino acid ABC transporter permease [Betaproteobacteria bacterium]|nr:branched-chain amino acid ABC transporter permease [Betaproteobacteria bacterium]
MEFDLPLFVENLLQSLVAGLLTGALYGLMCVGLSLIFGVMRVINFAQGDFMMLGMYAAYYAFGLLGAHALLGEAADPYLAALLAGPAVFVAGVAVHRFLVSRVTGMRGAALESEGHYAQLILTLGIALVLQNGGLFVFGSAPVSISTPLSSSAWDIGPLYGDMVEIFVNQGQTYAAIIAVVVVIAFVLLMGRSRLGKSLRAAADNPEAAVYMGIDVERAHRLAFGFGCAITAIGGGLLASGSPFQPYVGLEYVIIMYAGVVLGGLGSVSGAFFGGLTIGLVQQLSTLFLPIQLQNTAIFVVFLAIVLLRPQGLFGASLRRA